MEMDFTVDNGIYLVQSLHELDLHNDFDFQRLEYSVTLRRLVLEWIRGTGDWIRAGTPASVRIEFRDVSEFRFTPRDAEMPFTEDDCVASIGYWTDEAWCTGAMILDSNADPEPGWLLAFEFQSGAMVAVAAATANAVVQLHD
jgi:hypothetical protein